jgi:hypothetical protein
VKSFRETSGLHGVRAAPRFTFTFGAQTNSLRSSFPPLSFILIFSRIVASLKMTKEATDSAPKKIRGYV